MPDWQLRLYLLHVNAELVSVATRLAEVRIRLGRQSRRDGNPLLACLLYDGAVEALDLAEDAARKFFALLSDDRLEEAKRERDVLDLLDSDRCHLMT